MIDLMFRFGSEIILVKVDGTNIQFGNTGQGNKLATLDGLRLSYAGVVKEFPDLKDDSEWRRKAIQRFKDKISTFDSEEEITKYIIEDLKKFGYIPRYKQKAGFRPVKIT